MCYEVSEEMVEHTLSYLDFREKGGYVRDFVSFYNCKEDIEPLLPEVLVYTATESNPEFLGEAGEEDIALTLLQCEGPSGPNIEYFEGLFRALKEHDVVDEHVEEIDKHVRKFRSALQTSGHHVLEKGVTI